MRVVKIRRCGRHAYQQLLKGSVPRCLPRKVLRTLLAQGWGTIEYKSTAEVLADVRRVWDSYRQSYDPTDPVV